eukprot:6194940-Pleurochrysis_carterae.AAC.1
MAIQYSRPVVSSDLLSLGGTSEARLRLRAWPTTTSSRLANHGLTRTLDVNVCDVRRPKRTTHFKIRWSLRVNGYKAGTATGVRAGIRDDCGACRTCCCACE